MPPPISINNVPVSYFLHGVEAAKEAANAQQAQGAGGAPAKNDVAHQNPAAAKTGELVKNLDVLLTKAAIASTKSLSGKEVKTAFKKLVTDGALDKTSLDLLAKMADTAAKTMKDLGKFTGAQLAAAVKQSVGSRKVINSEGVEETRPHTYTTIDETTKAGKAIKAAVTAQNALSNLLTQLDDKLSAYERLDDEIRAANPDYWGVDQACHKEVQNTRLLCDRRATEIYSLAFQMHDFAVYQASRGENADPNISAMLKAKADELLPRQTLAMHGTADALASVDETVSSQIRPVAESIDRFRNNPSATCTGEDFLKLQSDIRTMKAAIADIKRNGVASGSGRMVVPKDIIKALETEVAKVEEQFNTAKTDVKKRVINNFLNTAYSLCSMKDKDDEDSYAAHNPAFHDLRVARETFMEAMRNAARKTLAGEPDKKIKAELKKADLAAEVMRTCAKNVGLPEGLVGQHISNMLKNAKTAATTVAAFETLLLNIKSGDNFFTGSEALSIFNGELTVSSIVENRARGMKDGDVDPANEPSNIAGSRRLGSGNAGTVFELPRKDGTKVVFKGEMEGRGGLSALAAGSGAAYKKTQSTVNLNIASNISANALGCGSLVVKYSAGVHDGTYGIFMEKAKGRCGYDLAFSNDKKGTPEIGLTGKEISKLAPEVRSRIKADIMRELNRLQWLDIVSGQMDRHGDNYFIHVDPQTHHVTVKGIDNDASFSKYRTGVATYALDASQSRRFRTALEEVLKNAGVREPKIEAANILSRDPGIAVKDGAVTINALNVSNKALLAALRQMTGVQSVAVPDRIDKTVYDSLMEFKNNPEKRRAYLDSLAERMDEENVRAAEERLNDAIDHAERLKRENKVVEGDSWRDVESPQPSKDRVSITLSDGTTKPLSKNDSNMANHLSIPSYFARDGLDKLFS